MTKNPWKLCDRVRPVAVLAHHKHKRGFVIDVYRKWVLVKWDREGEWLTSWFHYENLERVQ